MLAKGNFSEAFNAYSQSLTIAQRLVAADRNNTQHQRDLIVSYEKVGEVLVMQGKTDDALKAYRDSFALAERLAAADSSNMELDHDAPASYISFIEPPLAQITQIALKTLP